jgi:hypothetical protein
MDLRRFGRASVYINMYMRRFVRQFMYLPVRRFVCQSASVWVRRFVFSGIGIRTKFSRFSVKAEILIPKSFHTNDLKTLDFICPIVYNTKEARGYLATKTRRRNILQVSVSSK